MNVLPDKAKALSQLLGANYRKKTTGSTTGLRDKKHVDNPASARQEARGERDKKHVDCLRSEQALNHPHNRRMALVEGQPLLRHIDPRPPVLLANKRQDPAEDAPEVPETAVALAELRLH